MCGDWLCGDGHQLRVSRRASPTEPVQETQQGDLRGDEEQHSVDAAGVVRYPVRCRSVRAKTEFGSFRHLTGRFFGALWPGGPSQKDEEWVRQWLLPGEHELWRSMSGPDRRHGVGVARRTLALLKGNTTREVAASALLHDVGKLESGMGTVWRAAATALALVVGRHRFAALRDSERWWRRRLRLYFTHDKVGAALLAKAGSDPLTVAWAAQHHQGRESWTVDLRIADALKEADGD